MPKLTIDDQIIEVEEGTTVLQAAQKLNIEIPVFCYHPRLAIAGNCRMCLVEMEKSAKPIASCAMPAQEGMVIRTQSAMVEKARQGSLEFLLINHPLDCPICDQAGECDLQDITMAYGSHTGRFKENKRAVPNKNFGPLIKTEMNRCIHCTRCIRFATDIAGVPSLGGIGRGEKMEVGLYVEQAITSELSGNLIDICPVGALTSKPYAFKGRPWELKKTFSIDVLDAVGSAIRIDSRGPEVLRVLPSANDAINEEWISDKTRFACDGLKYQRLDQPYQKIDKKFQALSWEKILSNVAEKLKKARTITFVVGDMVDAESMFIVKQLASHLPNVMLRCCQKGEYYDTSDRANYLFNTTIAGIDNAQACLLIGTNPRWEAALINARLRKQWFFNQIPIGLIGNPVDLSYPYEFIGNTPKALQQLLDGTHPFADTLKTMAEQNGRSMIIVGDEALKHPQAAGLFAILNQLIEKYSIVHNQWNGLNILHSTASRVAALDLGFYSSSPLHTMANSTEDVIFLLSADDVPKEILGEACVIYQGHHGDQGAQCAHMILPGCAYTEKSGLYMNTEGRLQETSIAVAAPGEAKEDWKILYKIGKILGINFSYSNHYQLRTTLGEQFPIFQEIGLLSQHQWRGFSSSTEGLSDQPFVPSIHNFYMTDVISRHSRTMAQCTRDILHKKK